MVRLREFIAGDLPDVVRLFTDTVHRVNIRDYTAEQVAVWAPRDEDWPKWRARFAGLTTLLAEDEGGLLGFASFTGAGYLDFLYVHHQHQRRGVARRLLEEVEGRLRRLGVRRVTVNVSLTAKSFFEKMGYVGLRQQWFEKQGVALTNFAMEKQL